MRHFAPEDYIVEVFPQEVSMHPRQPRLLCAGKDLALLQTRCAVLRRCGYYAESATLEEAEGLLSNEEYDLVIISAQLSDRESARLLSVAGKTSAYMLPGFMLADELLTQVQRRLPVISGPDKRMAALREA